jgi:polysaccharide biosynthesis protein PslJ
VTSARVDWKWPVTALACCLLFVPPRVYAFSFDLPFELDPYRALLLGIFIAWILALLSVAGERARSSGLEGPIVLLLVAIGVSLVANHDRVTPYQTEVIKTLSVLASYLLTFYVAVSVLRRLQAVEAVLGALVLCGAVIAVLAIVETYSHGWSPFRNLDQFIPGLERVNAEEVAIRDGRVRAVGPAQHPLALGALLALLAPLAVAFALRRGRAVWWAALAALVIGSIATVSRTAIVMLLASLALFSLLRWQEAKRFLPLALVVLALTHMLLPGALGSLRAGLQPSYVAVEQRSSAESEAAGGRLVDLGPSLEEFRQKPLGAGYGTRISVGERTNARLLDNQWLATLLDMGILGVLALGWLFARFIGRLTRASAAVESRDGVLVAAVASTVFGYAIGMFFYDAFAFVQVTVVFFLILAAGCSLALAPDRIFADLPEPVVAPERVKREQQRARLASAAQTHRERVKEQLQRLRWYEASHAQKKDPKDPKD